MILRIQNNFIKYKERYFLGILLVFSLVSRVWYSYQYKLIWWDEAIYIGMGKYLATLGHIGFWEYIRPPILPIFYAAIFKLHLPLVFFGKSAVILASTILIYIVYALSEKIKKGTGIWAGLFLSITPVFFYFSKIPLSDIISAFFAILALYFFINKKDFTSGILAGVAFLTRFPQGLILVCILISLLYREYEEGDFYFKRVFYSGLKIIAGFLILLIPYLISNYLFYSSALEPILYANQIVSTYGYIYFKDFWYYASELFQTAPFLYFSIFSLFILVPQLKKNAVKNTTLVSVFFTAVIFCLYFFLQPHKELRFSIAFVSYIAILASVGISYILEKIPNKNILKSIFIIGIIIFLVQAEPYIFNKELNRYDNFYSYFSNKEGVYISTTPVPVVVSNVVIADLFTDYNSLNEVLSRRLNQIDGVVVYSEDIYCREMETGGNCDKEIENINKKLKENFRQVYDQQIQTNHVSVFEKIK